MRENRVLEKADGTGLQCDCGATCTWSDKKRFRERHPALCNERRRFNTHLAEGVKSVDYVFLTEDSIVTNDILEFIANVDDSRLTQWELEFIENISGRALTALSDKQKRCIARIYERLMK